MAERDFGFAADLAPMVVMFTQQKNLIDLPAAATGVAVVSAPDIRWGRRDIKSTGLLAQVLAKRRASEAGAAEVFMVEDGFVTEGGSSTAFIVTRDGTLVTRPLSNAILPGITRRAIMRLAAEDANFALAERPFTLAEAHDAAEVFFTSASTFVMPVISLDGRAVGDGRPGPLARRLRHAYIDTARADMRPLTPGSAIGGVPIPLHLSDSTASTEAMSVGQRSRNIDSVDIGPDLVLENASCEWSS